MKRERKESGDEMKLENTETLMKLNVQDARRQRFIYSSEHIVELIFH